MQEEGLFMEMLKVRTFGEFSLSLGNATLTYRGARSRKIWGLMVYLLCHRDRVISQQKLIGLFWGRNRTAPPSTGSWTRWGSSSAGISAGAM